jgi:hypothetical protein
MSLMRKIVVNIHDFLASTKLAMALLVATLLCCVAGVTIWRGVRAGEMIFGTLWFNGLLVLMVVNVACCFFGRIWGRRVTLISFGMILFHLSFVTILLGIVYNSLFYFRGTIRLTEGESLSSANPQSYDVIRHGKFFKFSRLTGETSLIKMHTGYKLGGLDKRATYEVEVGEPGSKTRDVIYITHKLAHRGVEYFNDKEGYSILVTLADKQGRELYGAHLPLQSFPGKKGFSYGTGWKDGEVLRESVMPFPPPPEAPRMALQVNYLPAKGQERGGEAVFQLYPLENMTLDKPAAKGQVPIGQPFAAGDYQLTAREVRYWAAMSVHYEPGKVIVLGSLWAGLAGMLITTIGRMRRDQVKREREAALAPGAAPQA